jgi:hypothetical protein
LRGLEVTEDSIKMNLGETESDRVKWIEVAPMVVSEGGPQ